jgi:hypothetical protein
LVSVSDRNQKSGFVRTLLSPKSDYVIYGWYLREVGLKVLHSFFFQGNLLERNCEMTYGKKIILKVSQIINEKTIQRYTYDNLTFARQLPCNCLMTASHSRFRHYFYSNLYEHTLRGPRGVKKSDFYYKKKLLRFCAKIDPKCHKLQKKSKWKKKIKKPCLLNPNWHEAGQIYPTYNIWIGFCQLNFYQKFPNI